MFSEVCWQGSEVQLAPILGGGIRPSRRHQPSIGSGLQIESMVWGWKICPD